MWSFDPKSRIFPGDEFIEKWDQCSQSRPELGIYFVLGHGTKPRSYRVSALDGGFPVGLAFGSDQGLALLGPLCPTG